MTRLALFTLIKQMNVKDINNLYRSFLKPIKIGEYYWHGDPKSWKEIQPRLKRNAQRRIL